MSEIRNEIIGGKQSDDGLSNNVDTYLNFTALQTALPTPTVGMLAFVQNTASTYVCYTAGIWTEQGGGSSALVERTDSFANQTNFIITHNLGRIPSIVRVLDLEVRSVQLVGTVFESEFPGSFDPWILTVPVGDPVATI